MAEYGSPEFVQLWRQKGLFTALDSSPVHGKFTREDLRRSVSTITDNKVAELRKQLSTAQKMLDLVDQSMKTGMRGAKVEQTHVEANMLEIAERVRSFADLFETMKWFLSEGTYRKSWICRGKDSVPAGHGTQRLAP